ncbi:MAG: hypothetical protein QM754_20080 [Tepidisphaeraceae bacterium]
MVPWYGRPARASGEVGGGLGEGAAFAVDFVDGDADADVVHAADARQVAGDDLFPAGGGGLEGAAFDGGELVNADEVDVELPLHAAGRARRGLGEAAAAVDDADEVIPVRQAVEAVIAVAVGGGPGFAGIECAVGVGVEEDGGFGPAGLAGIERGRAVGVIPDSAGDRGIQHAGVKAFEHHDAGLYRRNGRSFVF